MGFFEKIKNRYNIITFVLIILILGLSFRLAVLTIAQGDYYRDLADNKRYKEVYINAPRGEIRDRNGVLLAGNKPSFTIKLFKDEINLYEKKKKNDGFLTLMRIIEEDGVNYVDELPIELNVFKYKSEEDYKREELSPNDKVIEIIKENKLIKSVLNSHFIYEGYDEHYKFVIANRAINALKYKGLDIPIGVELKSDKIKMSFDSNYDIDGWKEEHKIQADANPIDSLISLIGDDKTVIRKIISNSISRELIYDILEAKNLTDNLILEDYAISYMESFLDLKRSLSKSFPEITLESEAADDFTLMFTKTSLDKFLQKIIQPEEDGDIIVPAQILMDMLSKKGVKVPIDIKIIEDEKTIIFEHLENKKFDEEKTIRNLIQIASDADIIKDFLSRDDIRVLAQSQLLNDGVNPRIAVSQGFEYVDINNLKDFYKIHAIKEDTSPEDFFQALREYYEIDKGLSNYEARGILVLYNLVQKQGYLAYQPIYLAYGLKETTVARIEEGLMDFIGIEVSIEGVRYYPEGTTAAHILGYLGKISQANEIKKYIDEKKYFRSAIIGKTGVEESFEDILSGTYGIKKIEVDSVGNTTSVLEEIKPIPGDNLYLSLDLNLQKVAEASLQQTLEKLQVGGTYESPWGNFQFATNKSKRRPYTRATSGAVVALDVKTGQVLASASYPAYDPNLFSTGISDSDWQSLIPEDEHDPLAPRPLYNIATQTAIQPGSVFKMAIALTALDKGLSPNKKIRDMGYIPMGAGEPKKCLLWTTSGRTHGYVDVYHALRDSCNYYFYSLAYGSNPRTGEYIGTKIEIEDIAEMSTKLGLNDRTGIEINIPREAAYGVPDRQRKILGQKNMLRRALNADIEKYFEEDFDYDDAYKKEVVEEIVSWSDEEVPLTRAEVIRRLEEMRIRPEYKLGNDRAGIADKIKFDYLDFAGWRIADTLDITIGQGINAYTPIQMANYVAVLSNGGYRHKLSLVDNITNYNDTETKYTHQANPERIELNDYSNLDDIKKGMLMVSNDGTARRVFGNFPEMVGSKTGTAQNQSLHPITKEGYDEYTWFVSFAPYDDPQIAVAVVLFQGGTGGHGAPMARDIIAQYLGLNE